MSWAQIIYFSKKAPKEQQIINKYGLSIDKGIDNITNDAYWNDK